MMKKTDLCVCSRHEAHPIGEDSVGRRHWRLPYQTCLKLVQRWVLHSSRHVLIGCSSARRVALQHSFSEASKTFLPLQKFWLRFKAYGLKDGLPAIRPIMLHQGLRHIGSPDSVLPFRLPVELINDHIYITGIIRQMN